MYEDVAEDDMNDYLYEEVREWQPTLPSHSLPSLQQYDDAIFTGRGIHVKTHFEVILYF